MPFKAILGALMKVASNRCEKAGWAYDGAVFEVKNETPVFNLLLRLMLKAFTVALVVLLAGSSGYAQKSRSPRVPPFVYGTWAIYRHVEVGGHAGQTKERAKAQIGKTLRIGVQSFDHDSGLLWLGREPCKSVRYTMKVYGEGEDDTDKGSLGFYGLEQAKSDRDEFVVVSCSKQEVCDLELAKNQELAVYYDGWFFFLRKTNGVSE
jgi:hypothetical protein